MQDIFRGRSAELNIFENIILQHPWDKRIKLFDISSSRCFLVKAFFSSMSVKAQELIDESVKYENDRQAGRIPTPRHR